MEKDFEELKNEINNKIREAVKLINEAAQLAETKNLTLVASSIPQDPNNEDYANSYGPRIFDCKPILGMCETAGWNTSSFFC